MAEPQWMSLRAYARRRGVALSAVQKAIETRRVTAFREQGNRINGIDPVEADKQWAANTDATEALRSGAITGAPGGAAAQGELHQAAAPAAGGTEKPAEPAAQGEQGNFLAARVKEAELRGQLLELDKLERIDELLPRSVVQKEFSEIFTQLKSAVFRIPDRKSQALAGETDATRIHRLLSDELRTVFDDFSRGLAQQPAAVAGAAVVAGEGESVLP